VRTSLAAMTILERQHPEEHGQRTNVVVSGDRPILFEHHVDVDAELERLQERLGLNGQRRDRVDEVARLDHRAASSDDLERSVHRSVPTAAATEPGHSSHGQ
jgi:hypothetical protein